MRKFCLNNFVRGLRDDSWYFDVDDDNGDNYDIMVTVTPKVLAENERKESTFHFPIQFVGQTNNSSSQCNRDLFLV